MVAAVLVDGVVVINNNINYQAWIQTYTGRRFTPLNPKIEDVDIMDIAHALSLKCRFSGHCKEFYSVAQHSVLVSYICDPIDAPSGLLHDGAETYLVDLPSPLKRSGYFNNFKDIENNLSTVIYKKYNLPEIEPISVKQADKIALATEAHHLLDTRDDWIMPAEPLLDYDFKALDWQEAKELFLNRFYELMNEKENCTKTTTIF